MDVIHAAVQQERFYKRKKINIILTFIFIILIPIWLLWIAPFLKEIPDNFSYRADILSRDNFYSEKDQKFQGEEISKTTFGYDVLGKKSGSNTLPIKNWFYVKTLNNKPIISVSRTYDIDPFTWKQVENASNKRRFGYLFGPRYAHKQDFVYWHVNYNAPAPLKFVGEETINGLNVYHYIAHYTADQTENLTYLPFVPKERGIMADIALQVWIEPISGWMVKYQDNSVAYYYDQKTKNKIAPWNKFTNTYTIQSLNEQIDNAKKLKWKILSIDFGVPGLLLLAAVFSFLGCCKSVLDFFRPLLNNKMIDYFQEKLFLTSIITIVIALFIVEIGYYGFWLKKTQSTYLIGISEWLNNSEFEQTIQGFKDGLKENGFIEGKNIKFIEKSANANIENQIDVIQSFQSEKVDLIFTVSSPGTLIAKGITHNTPVIFADVNYPVETGIIESLQSSGNNLVGVYNNISPALQYYYFEKLSPINKRLGFVRQKGDPNSEIQFKAFKDMLNTQGIQVLDFVAIDASGIKNLLEQYHEQVDALYLACDPLTEGEGGSVIADLSKQYKIPSFCCDKDNVKRGILMSYTQDFNEIGKLAARKAALILGGASPSWLHTEGGENFLFVINLETAKILELKISDDVIKSANEIIQ